MSVLVLDNYDSFTYNLVQYLGELGAEVHTVRNDRASVEELLEGGFERCVVSPGPCTPDDAGISLELVRRMPQAGVPTLGVCLGHQAIAQAFGGRAAAPAGHGRPPPSSTTAHDLPRPALAADPGRYHCSSSTRAGECSPSRGVATAWSWAYPPGPTGASGSPRVDPHRAGLLRNFLGEA
jgi:anthranilate synthase/aminodeoxychorismate synthase-like glutamine amidotransferase